MGKHYDAWIKRKTLASIEERGGKVQEHKGKIYIFHKGQEKPKIYRDWDEASAFYDKDRYDPFQDY